MNLSLNVSIRFNWAWMLRASPAVRPQGLEKSAAWGRTGDVLGVGAIGFPAAAPQTHFL